MTTALQQAFARLEELHPSLFDIHTEKGRTFVNEFSKFLEVERQQIGKTYFDGRLKEIGSGVLFDMQPLIDTYYDYYNETFKSE